MAEIPRTTPEMPRATLYIDLASPYAYLALERAETVLGSSVELQPILLGAIFPRRGWGSWAHTDQRETGIADVEERARRYGLPRVRWPAEWPANSLAADRAALWAREQGAGRRFIHAVYRRQFVDGEDISRLDVLGEAAAEVGLDPRELLDAIQRPELKQALRDATDLAWDLGVRGVPSTRIAGTIFFGDDKLEEAAAHLSEAPAG